MEVVGAAGGIAPRRGAPLVCSRVQAVGRGQRSSLRRVCVSVCMLGGMRVQACACACALLRVRACAHTCVYSHITAPRCSPAPSAVRAPALNLPDPAPRGHSPSQRLAPRVSPPPGLCPSSPAAASPQLPNVPGLTPSPCTGASCGWTSSCGTWASTSAPAGRAGSRARTAATSTAPRYPPRAPCAQHPVGPSTQHPTGPSTQHPAGPSIRPSPWGTVGLRSLIRRGWGCSAPNRPRPCPRPRPGCPRRPSLRAG